MSARFWRTLDERNDADGFLREHAREFRDGGMSRRSVLKMMAAAIAAGAFNGCERAQPPEKIVPYVTSPENLVPGRPLFYASAHVQMGYGIGVVIEQHEGHPTKVEGNPDHPSSLGGTNVQMQAAICDLYEPRRSKGILRAGTPASWSDFVSWLRARIEEAGGAGKVRIGIVTGDVTSATFGAALEKLRKAAPGLRVFRHEPLATGNEAAGLKQVFGREVEAVYDFTRVRRVLCLDGDFLTERAGSVRYAREFAQGRRAAFKPMGAAATRGEKAEAFDAGKMLRLYVAESGVSLPGAKADHRVGVTPAEVRSFARGLTGGPVGKWMTAVMKDLRNAREEAVVIAGENQPAWVHGVVHGFNARVRSRGVRYIEPVVIGAVRGAEGMGELLKALEGEELDIVIFLESNPVYSAAGDGVEEALEKFATAKRADGAYKHTVVHVGLHQDETERYAHWHVGASHWMECWSDVRGHDGTASVVQPVVQPLWETKSSLEVLLTMVAVVKGLPKAEEAREAVRRQWEGTEWTESLRKGVIAGTTGKGIRVEAREVQAPAEEKEEEIVVNLRGDHGVLDGRGAANEWLLEMPRPLSTVTWTNVAMMGPATAKKLEVEPESETTARMVRISSGGASVELPVWVQVGQPEGVVTVALGFGRRRGARSVGTDTFVLRRNQAMWEVGGAKVEKADGSRALAVIQHNHETAGRDLMRVRRGEEVGKIIRKEASRREPLSLYPAYPYDGYKWGMVVDQTACIGCQACVIACQAENNIPAVGAEEVGRGRDMFWLRIDTYYREARGEMKAFFQPMLCQHCENAPCELECPVGATTHSSEGLNEMTYNRCIGTRYCSNNCPYKVRRFNFFEYNSAKGWELARNPDVTVRSRGVMEKCTYCVQRINEARIHAEAERVKAERVKAERVKAERAGRGVQMRAGAGAQCEALPEVDVVTACQQACPAEAIIFGDLNDRGTYVWRLNNESPFKEMNYGVLTELNTQPRTRYLEGLENPNPEMEEIQGRGGTG